MSDKAKPGSALLGLVVLVIVGGLTMRGCDEKKANDPAALSARIHAIDRALSSLYMVKIVAVDRMAPIPGGEINWRNQVESLERERQELRDKFEKIPYGVRYPRD